MRDKLFFSIGDFLESTSRLQDSHEQEDRRLQPCMQVNESCRNCYYLLQHAVSEQKSVAPYGADASIQQCWSISLFQHRQYIICMNFHKNLIIIHKTNVLVGMSKQPSINNQFGRPSSEKGSFGA